MNALVKLLGLSAAACAACCALPLLAGGLATLGVGGVLLDYRLMIALPVIVGILGLTVLLRRRSAAAVACAAPDAACGCASGDVRGR